MKKPFGFKTNNFLSEALGQCTSDEEKVQLLSVFSQGDGFSNAVDSDDTEESGTTSSNSSSHSLPPPPSLSPPPDEEDPAPTDPRSPRHPLAPTTPNTTPHKEERDGCREGLEAIDGDEKEQLEWTFTLYDFDGKGRVTNEDIVSLVRSIYEALGSAKIPLKSQKNLATERKEFVGGFKVKLTLIPTMDQEETGVDNQTTNYLTPNKIAQKRKPSVGHKKSALGTHSNNFLLPTSPRNNVNYANIQPLTAAAVAVTGDKNIIKRPRRFQRNCGSPPGPNLLHGRHSQKLAPNNCHSPPSPQNVGPHPGSKRNNECSDCVYRDYVNLSELENCCSRHQAVHGIHHIRHCDRHCNCQPTPNPPSRYPPLNPGTCLPQYSPPANPNSCDYARLSLAQSNPHVCSNHINNQNSINMSRARNQAYFNANRTAVVAAREKFGVIVGGEKRTEEGNAVDKLMPEKPDVDTIIELPSLSPKHDKKHAFRNRERVMRQVREWVLNEAARNPPDTKVPPPKAPLYPGRRSRRMVVEHKHRHEHHHYVHQT